MLNRLDSYNVKWNTPGRTDRSSMPLGNGEVAINVWVEQDGDLQFYIARTDALTELDRNVKLGKIRVRLSPNPFLKGNSFHQELHLRDGNMEIHAGEGEKKICLRIFVDAESPTIYVTGEFASAIKVSLSYETWRTEARPSGSDSPLSERSTYNISESADIVTNEREKVLFYHRNGETCIPAHAALQGLMEHLDCIPDTLTNRTFGGIIRMPGAVTTDLGQLETVNEVTNFELMITTHSAQVLHPEDWIRALEDIHSEIPEALAALSRTAKWWNDYWQQSWIFVEGDVPASAQVDPKIQDMNKEPFQDVTTAPSAVTSAYVLTKWMSACSSRGEFPIMFNGSLFTVMPGGDQHYSIDKFDNFPEVFTTMPTEEPNLEFNPDERAWTHMNLWQNVRLSYHSMLARGETEMMQVLFRYYRRFWDLNRVRAHLYSQAEGQFNTEINTSFGLMPGWVFGLDREDLPVGVSANRHGGAVDISPGLELIKMMLDYYEFTSDEVFLRDELLPYAKDLCRYIETRFTERKDGTMVISPIHAVETYWDTTNSMPVVAGMHAVLDGILALPEEKVSDYKYFDAIRKMTPELPAQTVQGKKLLAPASEFETKRQNVELPEMYAVHPFELYGLNKPDISVAIDSLHYVLEISEAYRPYIMGRGPMNGTYYASYSGWQQIGMNAALLGLTEEAQTVLENNCQLTNPGFRFPAMWGPIYDCVPDTDHGANILSTLQLMAYQIKNDKIWILPAWPKNWDVSFKFHAPGQTIVECEYRDGMIVKLDVFPEERREDLIICIDSGNSDAK